jgi:beta-xylosidase
MILATAVVSPLVVSLCPRTASPAAGYDLESLGDFPDPFVLLDGGFYYAFATGARGENVQVARSRDRAAWERLSDALPDLPPWQRPGLTWAPSILRRAESFILYYTTRDAASGFQCISLARSERPQGPYRDDAKGPLVGQTELCGAIDPSPFVDDDGRAYLLWKSDENAPACSAPPRLWAQHLASDGVHLEGAPIALLAMDRAWEAPVIEGPSMVHRDHAYYLFYSANRYESAHYSIGYAICDSPLGPCQKATISRPLVASAGSVLGPGGQEPFVDPLGQAWMAFHAWSAPYTTYASGGARRLHLAKLVFESGVPGFAEPAQEAP